MTTTATQLDAAGIPDAEVPELIGSLARHAFADAGRVSVHWRGQHSNDVFEIRSADDRALMVKRGRYDWARERFEASAAAARLLGPRIPVPEPIPLPRDLGDPPLQAYWRIPLPTLESVWPRLSPAGRAEAMRSWGRLLARVHRVRPSSWGPLTSPVADRSLTEFLRSDLEDRLLPAIRGCWPEAAPSVESLLTRIPVAMEGVEQDRPTLAHNDVHMGNVLCRAQGDHVECVGLLDLEAAVAVPPEADHASLDVLHGPLFDQHISPRLRAQVWGGYGRRLDRRRLAFFRALHLGNLGFHSALIGDEWHAALVARALQREVLGLERIAG